MKTLGLFFTLNMSVHAWIKTGLFDREKLIYEEYIRRGLLNKIYWFTYGVSEDKKYEKKLIKGIEIIPMPKKFDFKLGKLIYSLLIPFIHGNILKKIDILKTNQMPGSWSAVLSRIIFRKPLIVRTGWTWSLNAKKEIKSRISFFYWTILLIEWLAYKICNATEVSSVYQKRYISDKFNVKKRKIYVVPNYIDTNIFKNRNKVQKRKNEFLFIGRLENEKNLFNLIKACSKLKIKLNIYGRGNLKKKLVKLSKSLNDKVNFKGSIANNKLPEIYNKYKFFILPSIYECMPKVLLEAMACGCVCIGTDVTGIDELIKDKINGILIRKTDENSLYKGISQIIKVSAKTINKYSKNASVFVKKGFTLKSIINKEEKVISNLLK